MNRVILVGRFARDPELRTTNTGKSVATFSLAVDRRFKQEGQPTADFFNIVAWGKQA
ncbi:single-stranded DNA-binding protein, partial [Eubacterium callanderi]|uniref:single-stranded DNA-binding protein n=1 Tax=Eubacterium callanderi TaxID=53442 RepID=UPI0022DF4C02